MITCITKAIRFKSQKLQAENVLNNSQKGTCFKMDYR